MSTSIVPPFTDRKQAARKVQQAEDLWNTRDSEKVAQAYTEDTQWRNRAEFLYHLLVLAMITVLMLQGAGAFRRSEIDPHP